MRHDLRLLKSHHAIMSPIPRNLLIIKELKVQTLVTESLSYIRGKQK